MGFEDDFDYNDDFETDIADPDHMDGGEQPKKLSRKELREAKKRNAEKTADLPRHKKGLFGKRERLDDNDESLTEDHIFDPTRSTMISTPRDRSTRERENAPIRSRDSEFSYLFDPIDDNESEDDVYPEKSIYSDSNAARDLLAGLSYDGSKDNEAEDFEKYFDEHSKPPESKFSCRKKKHQEESRWFQRRQNLRRKKWIHIFPICDRVPYLPLSRSRNRYRNNETTRPFRRFQSRRKTAGSAIITTISTTISMTISTTLTITVNMTEMRTTII